MIKHYFLIPLLLLMPTVLLAQDLIINNNSERIPCKIIREDSINIYLLLIRGDAQISTYIKRDELKGYYYDYYKKKQAFRDSIKMNQTFSRCGSIGFLLGGGSLIGYDVEVLLGNRVGMQMGIGFIGFGGGLNFHIKPDIRSSFISIQYFHQGIMDSYTQSLIGPSFVFRAKKLFTAQIGLGYALKKGPAWPSSKTQPPIMLTYAIGIYIPG
jgi:hypothetical protein